MLRSARRALLSSSGSVKRSLSGSGPGAVRPEHQLDEKALIEFLKSKSLLPEKINTLNIQQFNNGQSNPTYYLKADGDIEFVLRKKPPGALLKTAHDVGREYKVLSALAGSKVPVPKAILMCNDLSVLGTEWYLTDFANGRIFHEPWLPEERPEERRAIYGEMINTLAEMHKIDFVGVGLGDYGKVGGYIGRQVDRWTSQFESSKTHEIPEMTFLQDYLRDNKPTTDRTSLVHGDFRLDNLIYAKESSKVLATLDWELSTLGDQLCDLSYACMIYHIGPDFPALKGLKGISSEGVPTESEFLRTYSHLTGIEIDDRTWDFYLAFSFFRAAAILQGVYKRSLQGNASSSKAKQVGKMASAIAQTGKAAIRSYSTSPSSRLPSASPSSPSSRRFYSTKSPFGTDLFSPKAADVHKRVRDFVREKIIPMESELWAHSLNPDTKWSIHPQVEKLKAEARREGLWNIWLPKDIDPEGRLGGGLTNFEYGVICEEMGRSPYAPEIFNCNAPDTGNMEVLLRFGTDEQKEKYLRPILDGEIRSAFGMTEPESACSDATNVSGRIDRVGETYKINARKWWTSGAMDPRCKVLLFLGKIKSPSSAAADRHSQNSLVIVPMPTPGLKIERALSVFGYDDAPHGHAEITFADVCVPVENIVWGEGKGFEIAQRRLGPGRIHHCMRLIGLAERSLEAMIDRAKVRVAFGKPLIEQGTVLADIANSATEIEQARLLTLRAAELIDRHGSKGAMEHISMIKIVAPRMAQTVTDRAIQIHGAAGVSQDFPLAYAWACARSLRLADGPDEVHIKSLAKLRIRKH